MTKDKWTEITEQSVEEQTCRPKPGSIMPWSAREGKRWTITIRNDIAEKWTEVNPVLHIYEPAFERDTGNVKIGDGKTAWKDLPYCESLKQFLNAE